MRLFDCYDQHQTLSEAEFTQALDVIESYIFRRAITAAQTRSYWQVFANLAYIIDTQRPLESLQVGLATRPESYAFPGDAEFKRGLEEQDIYHKRVCFHLLDRLENHGSKEVTDTSHYSVEHIMPQNEKLGREWRAMLGDNWKEVQREWLHRLGNLTLTGYNSTYSDRPFADKKTIANGFDESAVRLNKYVREQPAWTAIEIDKRGRDLANRALRIWPSLVVDKHLVEAAKQADMRSRAKRHDVANVPMTATALDLFEKMRVAILTIDADIVELAEKKSVSYHAPTFFLEILPRKNRILLLLALEINEVEDPDNMAKDTSAWKFFVNAMYEGGVYVTINGPDDVDKALPIVRQSWELTRA